MLHNSFDPERDNVIVLGSRHWAETVRAIRKQNPDAAIELLIPDLDARPDLLDTVIASKPDILGHNIETVERLTPVVRSRAKYRTSLETLRHMSRDVYKRQLCLRLKATPGRNRPTTNKAGEASRCRLVPVPVS